MPNVHVVLALLAVVAGAPSQSKVSEPRSEPVSIPSKALGADIRAVVHLPAGYDANPAERYPVLYFLHGAGRGSERTWASRGTNETVAKLVKAGKLPACIVVCPRTSRMSFWINWKGKEQERHGDFVTNELPARIDEKFRTLKGRKFRGLMGDSMGGFGALVNALRNPGAFGAVSAHEPSIYPEDMEALPSWIKRGGRRGSMLTRMFGDPVDEKYWLAHNVFDIIKKQKPETFKDLPIYFDVGTRDRYGLDKPCQAWDQLLAKKKIKHTFNLRNGGHGSGFFVSSVPDSLAFHGKVFKAAMKARKSAPKKGK
ncbi:MAG: hypothetical protein CMJ83_04440 [Planctomycetes bacterium]|nr:hypothetical protein [Planctomycetota bacterium]